MQELENALHYGRDQGFWRVPEIPTSDYYSTRFSERELSGLRNLP